MTQMPPPQQEPTAPVVGRPGELLDRFLARLIDGIILGVVYFVLSMVLSALFLTGLTNSVGEWLLYATVLSVFWVGITIAYFAFMESSRGQTLGKMALRLQTFGPDGGHPTMEQSIRRNCFYGIQLVQIVPIIGWFLAPLLSLGAVIWIAVGINNDTVRRQGWHDTFAGGTYVLKVG
jgi:uncharacterized RDD family membrane protein YckC